ncbi:PREDICTED: cytosolic endo-beta-N-acetylglucosaminidase 1-like [Nelumbo nucifera]|uniref:mannosyl-glycoprotein endo-beta-N-acetylglucosaminidase n=2 Tax=Nelumbo nucifera TaxID=4432 RepID=A0A822Y140_NELNU|nr:PREDICTED: cytosolic endo-beta-N-acetylglucosaminidase 1-like [Nelumbo nucifera]DAD26330.1 TPA_asm: hypothetical protein HUJ06_027798 [Nelumbo nucifera]
MEPPFDLSKPSAPVSFPIKSLDDLESKSYFDSFHYPFNKASVPLPADASSLPDRARILVCHDMQGGYRDDKWIQGGNNPDAYAIWHWHLMDVFVYFSHNLVTIPPPCWTNTAHTHGVKVLGTFIMEWDEGRIAANKLLSTEKSARMYADRLTELAVKLEFDGWLINMEVQLSLEQIPNMEAFVSHLTQSMHAYMPGSLVIWYDSVTKDGALQWQNQLNDYNKPFFDICDGIFINYTWREDYPGSSAAIAGGRKFDVYMGIDVFGRGTYGGGQWNTNVALDVLKKNDVSAAIFAPGWVYETKQPPDFQTAQNRWWGLIEKSWGILKYYPKVLPFYSNFDQGHGYHFSVDGVQVLNDPWNNISCQSFQPVLNNNVDHTTNTIQVLIDFKDTSYSGGGNITFKGTLEENTDFSTRLFQGELPLVDQPVYISYSVKSSGSSLLGLALDFFSSTSQHTSVLLASSGRNLLTMNQFSSKFSNIIMPHQVRMVEEDAQMGPGWVIQESSIIMNGHTLTGIHAVCYKLKGDPNTLPSEPDAQGANSVAASLEYYASLGHITIKTKKNSDFPPSTSWLVESQYISWASGPESARTLSIKIIWQLKGSKSPFQRYNIYVKKLAKKAVDDLDGAIGESEEYLGVARVEAFYVSDLVVPQGISSLKFLIQVCDVDGACQKLNDSPELLMDV